MLHQSGTCPPQPQCWDCLNVTALLRIAPGVELAGILCSAQHIKLAPEQSSCECAVQAQEAISVYSLESSGLQGSQPEPAAYEVSSAAAQVTATLHAQ